MSTIDDLLAYLFEGQQHTLYAEFESWVRGSRRFKEFAIAYQSKIRTKLRSVRDEGGMLDLRAELETAAILLREDRFTLEYEHYAALRQRGPDFTVMFKTHTPFNVEVRRLRRVEIESDSAASGDPNARIGKLMAVLCDKVGQMPPSIINFLWLIAERPISEADLTNALAALRGLAERKQEEYFTRRGFENAADFLRHYRQLSGIVLRQTGADPVLWLNPLARHQTAPEIVSTLRRL